MLPIDLQIDGIQAKPIINYPQFHIICPETGWQKHAKTMQKPSPMVICFFLADCRWICHTKCGSTGLSISATCTKRYRRMPATTSTRLNVSEMKTLSSPCRLRNISIKVSSSSSSSQIWSLKLDLDIKYIYI